MDCLDIGSIDPFKDGSHAILPPKTLTPTCQCAVCGVQVVMKDGVSETQICFAVQLLFQVWRLLLKQTKVNIQYMSCVAKGASVVLQASEKATSFLWASAASWNDQQCSHIANNQSEAVPGTVLQVLWCKFCDSCHWHLLTSCWAFAKAVWFDWVDTFCLQLYSYSTMWAPYSFARQPAKAGRPSSVMKFDWCIVETIQQQGRRTHDDLEYLPLSYPDFVKFYSDPSSKCPSYQRS